MDCTIDLLRPMADPDDSQPSLLQAGAFFHRQATVMVPCYVFGHQRWTGHQRLDVQAAQGGSSTLWLCQNSYGKWPLIMDIPIKKQ